jgi:putrescine aminotransferase
MNAHPVIRLTPPAVLTPEQETRLLESFESACKSLATKFEQGA